MFTVVTSGFIQFPNFAQPFIVYMKSFRELEKPGFLGLGKSSLSPEEPYTDLVGLGQSSLLFGSDDFCHSSVFLNLVHDSFLQDPLLPPFCRHGEDVFTPFCPGLVYELEELVGVELRLLDFVFAQFPQHIQGD